MNNLMVFGFRQKLIGLYDVNIKPIEFFELQKSEKLVEIDFIENKAFIYNEDAGILSICSYPNFLKEKEFVISKTNSEFKIGNGLIFNYGFSPINFLINYVNDTVEKIYFHPTSKKGYKEQYKGSNNFGTFKVIPNNDFGKLLVCTDKGKSLIFNTFTRSIVNLETYKLFNFNKYESTVEHPILDLIRGIFHKNMIFSNIDRNLVVWDENGNPLLVDTQTENIAIDSTEIMYSLTGNKLSTFCVI